MVNVFVSTVIDASPDRVWAIIRDFNGLPDWMPVVASSRIENDEPSDRIGCVRNFVLEDGGQIRERLLSLSDYDYACSYAILSSPMGVRDYVANMRLIPVTDTGRTFMEWSARFDCEPGRERELQTQIGEGVFLAGMNALKARLGGGGAWSSPPHFPSSLPGPASRPLGRQSMVPLPNGLRLSVRLLGPASTWTAGTSPAVTTRVHGLCVPPPPSGLPRGRWQ